MTRRLLRSYLLGLCLPLWVSLSLPVRAQTPALDAERSARSADAFSPGTLQSLSGLYRAARLLDLHAPDASSRARFLAEVARGGTNPLARAHARALLAERLVRAGALDKAAAEMRAIGVVDQALWIGPFSNTGGSAFGTPSPADDVAATLDRAVPGVEHEARWRLVRTDVPGVFDLSAHMSPVHDTRARLAFAVDSARAQGMALRVGSSGQLRAWVNGVEVGRADAQRDRTLDQSVMGCALQAGLNLVVLELGFLDNAAAVTVRLTAPDGAALSGVRVLATADALSRAAATRPSRSKAPAVEDPFLAPEQPGRTRMLADLETYLGASDERERPRRLTTWFESLLADSALPAVERASWAARLGVELRDTDLTRARELYQQALALDPTNVPAHLELADIRDDQGRIHDARQWLQRAAQAAPTSDVVQQRLLDFNRRHGDTGVSGDEAVLERARQAPSLRNLGAAVDVLEERGELSRAIALVTQAEDAAWRARLLTEAARLRMADDPSALSDVIAGTRAQLQLRPGNHDLAERLVLLLASADRAADAQQLVDERRARYPERAEPDAALAKLALRRGDLATARTALAAAIAKKPQDAELAKSRRALEAEDELVSRYGVNIQAVRLLPPSAEATDPGAEVLASTTAIRLFDNGLARVITDQAYRVIDAKKARGLQTLSFGYSDGRETLDVLVAERWDQEGHKQAARRVSNNRSDGKVGGVYTDAAARVVDFGPLQDGDVLFVRTRKELVGQQNLFGDFFGVIEPLQSFLPTRNWRLVVEADASKTLSWGGRGAPSPTISAVGGLRAHDFTRARSAALVPEPGMPPYFELTDFLSISTYDSWTAMGSWYESLAAPSLVLDDELRAVAQREKAAATDSADLVRRLYEYVVTSTRYVGIELGIHGWKPYPVSEVHRRKYGDCKDKASLLVVLLREAGIPANLALVRTANLGQLQGAPPSMWSFNHAIAYVPSLDLFLDGTAEQSGWRELPAMDQGAQALIVGKHGAEAQSELVVIPVQPADANLNLSDYVLRVTSDGALQVKGSERFAGVANAQERRQMHDPATRRDVLQEHLARIMPGTQVHSVTATALGLDQGQLGYDFEATLPARAVPDGSGGLVMPVSLYPHDLGGSYAERSTRKTDLYIDHPWHTRNVMRYVLPPGMAAPELPAGGAVQSAHLKFTQRIERTADGFVVDEDTWLLSRRVPAADYPSFRRDALAADALMKRKLRLVRRGGAP